jgi:hypothetical protein
VVIQLGISFATAVVSAAAVQLGFGAAFVDDAVAYPIAAYVCALAAFVARPKTGSHPFVRVPVAVAVGGLTLWALRTFARVELPFGSFLTTGHWPFFALPAAALTGELANTALARVLLRSSRRPPVDLKA